MKAFGTGLTDVGRQREDNQDCFLVDNELGLYVVSDGMGGHAAGDLASRTAVEALARFVRGRAAQLEELRHGDTPDSDIILFAEEAVQRASTEVYRLGRSKRSTQGMGATLTALLVLGERAVMAHVGDSRLYLLREDQVHQLSDDHSYVTDLVRLGMVEPEKADDHHYRNVLTRSLGRSEAVQVDTLLFDLLPRDTLVLCSDGFSNYLRDAADLLEEFEYADLDRTAEAMVEHANSRGGSDNITVLLVRITVRPPEWKKKRATEAVAHLGALRQDDLFADLHLSNLLRVLRVAETLEAAPGEDVCRQGDPCSRYWIVVSGRGRRSRDGADLGTVEKGQSFGGEALLWNRPSRTTVTAETDMSLLALPYEAMDLLLRRFPRLGRWMYQRLALRYLDDPLGS